MDKLSEFCYFTYIDILFGKIKMQIVEGKMDKKEKMIIGKVGKVSMNIWAKLIWDKSRIIHVKCLVAKSHCYHECRIKIKKKFIEEWCGHAFT